MTAALIHEVQGKKPILRTQGNASRIETSRFVENGLAIEVLKIDAAAGMARIRVSWSR
jgi:hypothetical protein